MHRDHPALQFVAMCYAGVPSGPQLQYFLNAPNHAPAALQANWPPTYLTFHIYEGPGAVPGLLLTFHQEAKAAADFIITESKGRTKPAVDEMGIFGAK